MTKNKRLRAIFYLVITALLWSMGGLLIKLVDLNSVAIAAGRSIIAAIIIMIVMGVPDFKIKKYEAFGALSYTSTVILYVSATKLTTAANAILLQYTAPVYVALLSSYFLNEKITAYDWFTILIVVLGMSLFFFDKLAGGSLLGNILAILSGLGFALTAIFLRKLKDGKPINLVIYGNILTGIIGMPFLLGKVPSGSSIIGLILLGVFQLGISYIFYSEAIKNVSALEGILIPILEPILNPVWVFIFIGERPGFWSLIGGLIVLTAITIRCIKNIRV